MACMKKGRFKPTRGFGEVSDGSSFGKVVRGEVVCGQGH